MAENVFFFGNGQADGSAGLREILGGKGANLAEMTQLGIPVPPGFTISTRVCKHFIDNDGAYPDGLEKEVRTALAGVESAMESRFGDRDNPLLVSVRSGAAVSMPGMMDTVLNLGLNDQTIQGLIRRTDNPRFAWDAYRRFVNMFGDVVMGVDHEHFEATMSALKKEVGATLDTDLQASHLEELVKRYRALYKSHTGEDFPSDPMDQLWRSIGAVFGSWNIPRAVKYRQLHSIQGLLGTAVNVQAMVFGNMGTSSATGVAFTRNPSDGTKEFYGEFLLNAQGEDVVAGIRTPLPIAELEKALPEAYSELLAIKDRLEKHYTEIQDVEFTIQEGRLFMLQTRSGKRTARAAIKIAVDMVREGMIDEKTALLRVDADQLDTLLHPTFDPKAKKDLLAKGLPASPGASTGKIVFQADRAEEWAGKGQAVLLVRNETSPEDIGGMHASKGILTATGGMTSHAAVVARGMGKCCVAGCGAIRIDYDRRTMTVGDRVFHEGDDISLDGTMGEVYAGKVATIPTVLSEDFHTLMGWADRTRRMRVRTNADTPTDARRARENKAEGIGLCRTEHMFFEPDRILAVREMIMAAGTRQREKALEKLLPMQKQDFVEIFKAMESLPVTIRLLDPPLHEFIPQEEESQKEMARSLGVKLEVLQDTVRSLHEFNPMLGHRGCRLGITYPEIYIMQTRAIIEAACEVAGEGVKVLPEIMIPLIGTVAEYDNLDAQIRKEADRIIAQVGSRITYLVGTMIEVPRAALTAAEIAPRAQFFSFGTNDLTQLTYGYSRDDVSRFLPQYLEMGILPEDPFQVMDQTGVGRLVELATREGREARTDLKVGICGEHGGDPRSVEFCHRLGLDYVSCSPFRVPVARLAAAQAQVREERKKS